MASSAPLHLRLPATSANLGPGFDAVALAMTFYLTIDASVVVPTTSAAPKSSIIATGRNADLCSNPETSLILSTYRDILAATLPSPPALTLTLHNQIPLGMGCGSSAAALLAGVLIANHFGELGWSHQRILEEACRREGHPDNIAACWHGGMTSSICIKNQVVTATCGQNLKWTLCIALPPASMPTSHARAMLPESYTKADAIANVQGTALLVSAFALNRGDLLHHAMRDRFHQPYRMDACPLLRNLLPLNDYPGIYGVALSGAGPSVLVIAEEGRPKDELVGQIHLLGKEACSEVILADIDTGGLLITRVYF